jgi:hypothetical protein
MVSFTEVFDSINLQVPFNQAWVDSPGYLGGAVKGKDAPQLQPGVMVKTVTKNGRRIILIGTRFGNTVVLERFKPLGSTDGLKRSQVIVTNVPRPILNFLSGEILGKMIENNSNILLLLLGKKPQNHFYNIGERIENFFKEPIVSIGNNISDVLTK